MALRNHVTASAFSCRAKRYHATAWAPSGERMGVITSTKFVSRASSIGIGGLSRVSSETTTPRYMSFMRGTRSIHG